MNLEQKIIKLKLGPLELAKHLGSVSSACKAMGYSRDSYYRFKEFYDTAFRKKVYLSLDDLQKDVDIWLKYYNEDRTHSGKFCYGKTPLQTFLHSKNIALEKSNQSMYILNISDSHNLTDSPVGSIRKSV
jgi:hypothetical protein